MCWEIRLTVLGKKHFRQDDAFGLPGPDVSGTVPRTVFCECRLCALMQVAGPRLSFPPETRAQCGEVCPLTAALLVFSERGQEVRVGAVPGRCPQSGCETGGGRQEALSKECHPSAVTTGAQLPWGPHGLPASCCFRRTRQGLSQPGSHFAGRDGLKRLPPVLHCTFSEGLLSV